MLNKGDSFWQDWKDILYVYIVKNANVNKEWKGVISFVFDMVTYQSWGRRLTSDNWYWEYILTYKSSTISKELSKAVFRFYTLDGWHTILMKMNPLHIHLMEVCIYNGKIIKQIKHITRILNVFCMYFMKLHQHCLWSSFYVPVSK